MILADKNGDSVIIPMERYGEIVAAIKNHPDWIDRWEGTWNTVDPSTGAIHQHSADHPPVMIGNGWVALVEGKLVCRRISWLA